MSNHVDVLILGAGISGIGAACHLSTELPGKSYAVIERRDAIGGTWDLFRYPGIRSDSDMLTFGYNFRPWLGRKVLADGGSIRQYVQETAAAYGVTDKIRYGLKVVRSDFDSEADTWTVTAVREATGATETFTCSFLMVCTGYYNYDSGYRPEFPGEDSFTGTVVHPQQWPQDLDYAGKKVVVIGSGATAITLVPSMAEDTERITMLQRSPSYIISLPAIDGFSATLRKVLPEKTAYKASRAKNIVLQRATYALAQAKPELARKVVVAGVKKQLDGHGDLADFQPKYNPWDQRLCIIPDGDLFRSIREGKADVVTGEIASFTPTGIKLSSGQELAADIIVSATGLDVQTMGGSQFNVDGEPVSIRDILTYKSVLLEKIPNAAMVFGYINASWTLKADLAAEFVCRLLKYMDQGGYSRVVPVASAADRGNSSMLSALNSGYVRRGDDKLPRQGIGAPWRVLNNYLRDAPMLRFARFTDPALRFTRAGAGRKSTSEPQRETVATG